MVIATSSETGVAVAFDRVLRGALFDRVCAGASVAAASRALGVSKTTGKRWWREAGGMKLNSGAVGGLGDVVAVGEGGPGRRLSLLERHEISVGVVLGWTCAQIARAVHRHRSTITRELDRNSNDDRTYHPLMAHYRAASNAKRPKAFKLVDHPMEAEIAQCLDWGWSPKLIADVIKRVFVDDKLMWVSHETIYKALYVQTRGTLRADLAKSLSTKRTARKSRGKESRVGKPYRDAFTIADRPDIKDTGKVT
jgi:hypothetical protein